MKSISSNSLLVALGFSLLLSSCSSDILISEEMKVRLDDIQKYVSNLPSVEYIHGPEYGDSSYILMGGQEMYKVSKWQSLNIDGNAITHGDLERLFEGVRLVTQDEECIGVHLRDEFFICLFLKRGNIKTLKKSINPKDDIIPLWGNWYAIEISHRSGFNQ